MLIISITPDTYSFLHKKPPRDRSVLEGVVLIISNDDELII